MKKKKRQITKWIFYALYTDNTYIKVGFIHNKNKGNKFDVIRLKIKSQTTPVDFNMRLDEAVGIAAGLNKVAVQMLVEQLPGLKKYVKEFT